MGNYSCAILKTDRSTARPDPGVTWHRILSFNHSTNNYLRNLLRGSRVYVEANLEIREPDRDAEPGSPAATRQVYLRHGMSPTTQFVGFTLITLQRPFGSSKTPTSPRSMAQGGVEAAREIVKNNERCYRNAMSLAAPLGLALHTS